MKDNKNPEKLGSDAKKVGMLREGNISLILGSYNDIFSDFDPRPYSERALSDDFLFECKKAARDKKDTKLGLELRLLVPHNKRNISEEATIKKRLKNHSQKHFREMQSEIRRIKREGLVWFLIGAFIITVAALLYKQEGFFFNFLFVIMEPAGWFTMWTGLDKIFSVSAEKKVGFVFYKKMLNSNVYFLSY